MHYYLYKNLSCKLTLMSSMYVCSARDTVAYILQTTVVYLFVVFKFFVVMLTESVFKYVVV